MAQRFVDNLPTTCKAACVKDKGLQYTLNCRSDYPVPKPGPNELLVKLNCTGICMSDHHYMNGDWGAAATMLCECCGHEGAGVVVGLGERVNTEQWKLGDRVGMKPLHQCCHQCVHCRNGQETLCDLGPYTGIHYNGSYAEYVTSPADYTARIPDGVPDEVAGPIMCSGATVYSALKRARSVGGLSAGEFVVVIGAGGGVGSMCVTYANALGYRVIGIDGGEGKKKMVLDMGAEYFVDFQKSSDTAKEVHDITKGGAHAVINCGGSAAAYKGSPDYLRKSGILVCVGLPSAGAAVNADVFNTITRKLIITGSLLGTLDELEAALDLAARKKVKPFITVCGSSCFLFDPWSRFAEVQKNVVDLKTVGRSCVSFSDDVQEHRVGV